MRPLPPHEITARRQRGLSLQSDDDGSPRANYAVLSSFNVDLGPPFLVEALDRVGVRAAVSVGDFGQIAQQLLNPAASVYENEPEAVLIVPAAQDMLGFLFDGPPADDAWRERVDERLDELTAAVQTLLERVPAASCYVVAFGSEMAPVEHILAPGASQRGQLAVERFVAGVRGMSELSPRVVVVDWEWHSRAGGTSGYRDERLWYLGRMRLNPAGLAALAELTARHVAAYQGLTRKVVAVDLDDTLWGGVVGEAGLGGIVLGEEGVGLAFQDFQRQLVSLHDTGALIVACSKNNPDDVSEVFDRHPGMVLRREQLAAERIGWDDKASGLRAIAEELGLGLDSFVFLDDNPVERDWVRQAIPEVAVPDLPEDPVNRPEFLRSMPYFQRLTLSDADRQRADSYKAQGARTQMRSKSVSFEDFLASLEQEVTIDPVHEGSVGRAAQLCQRTNQFNLTTRRHTPADIEAMQSAEDFELHTVAVSDRFGDSGITGLSILRFDGHHAELDTFLLSCRVLGRHVEDALLAYLATRAQERGCRYLDGRYIPSDKNSQAASFYSERGFKDMDDGRFRLDLNDRELSTPSGISVKVAANA